MLLRNTQLKVSVIDKDVSRLQHQNDHCEKDRMTPMTAQETQSPLPATTATATIPTAACLSGSHHKEPQRGQEHHQIDEQDGRSHEQYRLPCL